MHYSTCSCSTLPLPRPAAKNHSNIYLPLPDTTYGKELYNGLVALFGKSDLFDDISSESIFGVRTDALWCMDGVIYYSCGGQNAEFDPNTLTWKLKSWNNTPPELYGRYIWSDGIDVYFTYASHLSTDPDYILNKDTETWETIQTTKPDHFYSMRIWTDGIDTYYSDEYNQKIWNRATHEWVDVIWNGENHQYFQGYDIWKDVNGDIYHSGSAANLASGENNSTVEGTISTSSTWKLDKSTKTWIETPQYISDGTELVHLYASSIWYDGEKLRINRRGYSNQNYFERRSDGLWYEVSDIVGAAALGSGNTSTNHNIRYFAGDGFWSDGTNIFYSSSQGGSNGILLPVNSKLYVKAAGTWYKIGQVSGMTTLALTAPTVSATDTSGELLVTNPEENYKKVIQWKVYKADGTYVKTEYFSDDSQIITGLTSSTVYQISAIGTDGTESERSVGIMVL